MASPNVGAQATVEETAPADVYRCLDCGALQLLTMVDPEFQYRTFKYTTGVSAGLVDHFRTLIDALAAQGEIAKGKLVFDIGSNDGSLLQLALPHGARVLGIDPAVETARTATTAGIPTIGEFFSEAMGRRIKTEHGPADLVISANTVANIDDLDDFFAGVASVMADDGLFIIETQYALDVLEKTLLDVIYHEHISYFAVKPMRSFLAHHGLELVDAARIAPKGGSIRFYIQKRGGPRAVPRRVADMVANEEAVGLYDDKLFSGFNQRIAKLGEELHARLERSRRETGRALAFGSSVGCAALVHYFDLGKSIDAIFDDHPFVNYMRRPGGTIPVLSGAQLANEAPTDVAVLAWRYADLISARQADFCNAGGRFYTVLPDVKVVADASREASETGRKRSAG
ncbi:MAG: class I SAM-dependent methyltransferase [Alphaproteobacteria bacterium]|nr:class I SAM-dependent methyltransferase [Alphaproteobacteria bacterium]